MKLLRTPYIEHFGEYGCRFCTTKEFPKEKVNPSERELLSKYGLPDSAIPFFYFDFHLAELRDLELEDALIVLGTAIEMAGFDYLYLANDHQIKICLRDGNILFVNSSLEQFMQCIYQYSVWLEDIEDRALDGFLQEVESEDVFNLFYSLRTIDSKALKEGSMWAQIIQSEVNFEMVSYE
ncbi:MAG: hypothetical protein EA362_04370 [Saprospirales bacterium]|nr:MAG: hypothetical protein EA362_04370 [Saprospirales bacterium]